MTLTLAATFLVCDPLAAMLPCLVLVALIDYTAWYWWLA